MSKKYFEDLSETVERARERDLLTEDVRLTLLGQVLYASVRGDLTAEETERLQKQIGEPENWRQVMDVALFGDDEEYQRELAETR